MSGLFSVKYCLRYLSCVCLFLIMSSLLFLTYPEVRRIIEENPRKLDYSYASFPFDIRKEQRILRYFERKEQIMKQSPARTVLRNTFQKPSNKTSFLIYEHTNYRQFCRRQNSASIYISTCPFRNCHFTCNSSFIHEADVVLMLYSHLTYKKLLYLSVRRNPKQIWLLWHDEPYLPAPVYNRFLFNWTISYRLDSEISVATYGITFVRNEPMNQIAFNSWINENFKKRSNQAVWFVSNCGSKERLHYYEQLKQHFSIAAFGKCIVNQTQHSHNCIRSSECEVEKLSTSKFYLAFESTTLRIDYITEKFWRSLSYGVIPIVLGPKRGDYERVAPPNSFIYAKDYSDPQTLAKHLYDVATNQHEYKKYHKWRMNYETRHLGQHVEPVLFCELCYKLNTNRDRIWYTDLHQYFAEID